MVVGSDIQRNEGQDVGVDVFGYKGVMISTAVSDCLQWSCPAIEKHVIMIRLPI